MYMSEKKTVTLLIATYNWPDALELVLLSILGQTRMPDEIVLADDGSDYRTRDLITKYKKEFQIPLIHVWHADEGFRLAKIRNMAIAKASCDYIVQIDGDIILHPRFIEDHFNFSVRGSFVRASRVYINPKVSQEMLTKKTYKINAFSRGVTNFFSALRVPFLWKFFETDYKNVGDELYEIHGCNMAYWREDAIKVNGYNELFNGWGPEDKEFIARLLNSGVRKRFIKLGAIAFHIYHQENQKTFLAENISAFKDSIAKKSIFCEKGINQYL